MKNENSRTFKQSRDLCDSCQFSTKISGYGNEIKICAALDGERSRINWPVERCTSYQEKGVLAKYELEQIAIYIEKKKDSVGFKFTKHVNGSEVEFK